MCVAGFAVFQVMCWLEVQRLLAADTSYKAILVNQCADLISLCDRPL